MKVQERESVFITLIAFLPDTNTHPLVAISTRLFDTPECVR